MAVLVDAPRSRRAVAEASPERFGAVRWVLHMLAWFAILASLLVLVVTVALPRLVGGTPYTILTGSMEPRMPPGTLVVDKPADLSKIGVGTVVTYQLTSGESTVVTHRVVAIRTSVTGGLEFQTKGDANPTPDPKWVKPVQIRGIKWYSIPVLGRLNILITGHQRQLSVYGVAVGLVLYAGVMFAGAGRDRRRRGPGGSDAEGRRIGKHAA